MNSEREVIGLIPAAGKASRISPLPCSKEIFPLGFHTDGHDLRPKVVGHYLLEKMQRANISKTYVILRNGKWDIPTYFSDGRMLDLHIAYLVMNFSKSVPCTLDQAFPFIQDSTVALGFPDSIFQPDDAFVQLLDKQKETNADVVLGLFPAAQPHKTDLVEFDNDGNIRSIQIKPERTELIYAWEIAVWTPAFTRFMHNYVMTRCMSKSDTESRLKSDDQHELHVGDVFQAAINHDMHIDSVTFKTGNCLDIGTPEDLQKAVLLNNQSADEL